LTRIIVKRRDAKNEHFASVALRDELTAAVAAKVPSLSRRRFERLEYLGPFAPLEVLALDTRRRVERRGVSLATSAT
jgi:hypothetical protein